METFELRYFLAAAESESVISAATKLSVSSPAISRAISRLEEELGIQLFERKGRNIVLSAAGKDFQRKASRIIADLDDLKAQFKPTDYTPVSLIGTEFGLSAFLNGILGNLNRSGSKFSFEIKTSESSKTVESSVLDGESRLGIISRAPSSGLAGKRLGMIRSRVYIGKKHPLYLKAKRGEIPIAELLEYDFASFLSPSFLESENALSPDGWRDDKFKRKVAFKSDSVPALLSIVDAGGFVGYFPEHLALGHELLHVNVSGCPYKCETSGYLIARDPNELSWMKWLFK
jgi:DNA-binding transcriptional LysR family regulator